MAITALQLITNSMRLLGAVASGESPTADEQTDALQVLNDMLDSCNTDQLSIFTNYDVTFNTVAAKQAYTIGPAAADITATRPVGIEYAYSIDNGLTYPIMLANTQQWADVLQKTYSEDTPRAIYYEAAYPLGVIKVWPVPSAIVPITISVNSQFAPLATTAASIAYPPGYGKWLRYQLAVELGPEFKVSVSDDIRQIASDTLAAIKGINRQQPVTVFDPALTSYAGSGLSAFLAGY
jgi:hypothetical protein